MLLSFSLFLFLLVCQPALALQPCLFFLLPQRLLCCELILLLFLLPCGFASIFDLPADDELLRKGNAAARDLVCEFLFHFSVYQSLADFLDCHGVLRRKQEEFRASEHRQFLRRMPAIVALFHVAAGCLQQVAALAARMNTSRQ